MNSQWTMSEATSQRIQWHSLKIWAYQEIIEYSGNSVSCKIWKYLKLILQTSNGEAEM